jgi:DNA-directed RNA polymerase subunit RPC12/RpoP
MGGAVSTYPCSSCGAELEFQPGTTELVCPYCRGRTAIAAQPVAEIREIDYAATLGELEGKQETVDKVVLTCDSCHATVEMAPNVTAQSCPFCGSRAVATGTSQKLIKPKAVAPFVIDDRRARDLFAKWLGGLWFAPGKLKRFAQIDTSATGLKSENGSQLKGMYLPYWTYDAQSVTPYTGQRGDNYQTLETYTTYQNGKPVKGTRMVTKVRWTPVSGTVRDRHDDVLVAASASLPAQKLKEIGRWDLSGLKPYDDAYLSGFRAESYVVDLKSGFGAAQEQMADRIRDTICADIGGDHQRISSMSPLYSGITFKHILLPVWVSAYRYNGKVYRFLVNGQTGAVSGERPWSAWKITFAVLAGLAIIGIIVLVASQR